jgi:tetratricopeptide (TPR) repeat protein
MNFENDAKEAEAAGDYLAAIDYYLLVLESVDDINSLSDPPFYFGNICSRLAYLYSEVGDLVSTVKYLRKAVKSCLESSEPLTKVYPKVGDCYTNLGVCFLAKANYKIALGYFSKAVEFNEECLNLGKDEILQYVAECAVFNYSLSTLSSITLTSKRHDLLPYLLKAISLSETH